MSRFPPLTIIWNWTWIYCKKLSLRLSVFFAVLTGFSRILILILTSDIIAIVLIKFLTVLSLNVKTVSRDFFVDLFPNRYFICEKKKTLDILVSFGFTSHKQFLHFKDDCREKTNNALELTLEVALLYSRNSLLIWNFVKALKWRW